ncbi:MAG: methyltransferase domain-containing protein [Psychroserpens sp.]|uniref:class I SAM-dependent methyltransferase n=1 Tax=Psychroserpens sp. TaxID=2020870 RepID=UPI003001992D
MKFLDRVLRDWRIREGSCYIRPDDKVLDFGCFDGYLFKTLEDKPIQPSIGIDPLLKETIYNGKHKLISGKFPESLSENETFDCIVMLAVLEHIPRVQQKKFSQEFFKHLNPNGRIIITVPSPFVDHILTVLTKLGLIEGMSVDEHYGFETKEVFTLFEAQNFRLLKHKKFQLGLNNLFVFEKLKEVN